MSTFYEGVIGLRPGKRSHRFVSFGVLSLIDEKAALDLSGSAVDTAMEARRHRIQVHVNDIEAAHHRVEQSGGRIVQAITEMPWRERVFHCVDPEGNLVEVSERR